ncbi:hypothetical protein [Cupriavidus necator]|uniref:hypothetical protein n=1 Tax=Cupriavidus necator TaxID=106590 RepID=UPI0012D30013|nr:hypothetical protein [Cupriavidus necator]
MRELKVSSELWEEVSEKDKGKIEGIMLAAKVMSHEDKIVPDTTIAKDAQPQAVTLGFPGDILKPACQAACVAAGAAAAAACAGLNPIAAAACMAVAQAGVEECKNRC